MKKTLVVTAFVLASATFMFGGGPLFSGSNQFGTDGQPILWDLGNGPVQYRVDGGPLARVGTTTVIDNATGSARVQAMFQTWQNVPTSDIAFQNLGALQSVGGFTDGDVSSVGEFNALVAPCDQQNFVTPTQTSIVFDADGSLFQALIGDPFVIGVTAICQVSNTGKIRSAFSVMNGRYQDGISTSTFNDNFELTADEFDQAFTHEFGHLIGMDHSQANVDILDKTFPCALDDLKGLPIMFPFLACQSRVSAGLAPLAPDDAAWVSKLYPSSSFATTYGIVRGKIYFSDGQTPVQGVNVLARRADDPATPEDESRQVVHAVVSGYLFTVNPGQSITGTNTGGDIIGSRNGQNIGFFDLALLPGDYTLEVESVDLAFAGGSSVGPLSPAIPNPGVHEYWDNGESDHDNPDSKTVLNVVAGATITRDIILNGTYPRLDNFEDEARSYWPHAPGAVAGQWGGR